MEILGIESRTNTQSVELLYGIRYSLTLVNKDSH
jgi:hypothetical protein